MQQYLSLGGDRGRVQQFAAGAQLQDRLLEAFLVLDVLLRCSVALGMPAPQVVLMLPPKRHFKDGGGWLDTPCVNCLDLQKNPRKIKEWGILGLERL